MINPSYLHPLNAVGTTCPAAFTFPFRYEPHPLCMLAAEIVQQKLSEMHVDEGKMYGVIVVRSSEGLAFIAAYSGQLGGSYSHPWFAPPIVDYLAPESYFQKEQAQIVELNHRIDKLATSSERQHLVDKLSALEQERDQAIDRAKRIYAEAKARREAARHNNTANTETFIRESQRQKADIHRAKLLHAEAIEQTRQQLAAIDVHIQALRQERKRRSEDLQQWLFDQFDLLNAAGEHKKLTDIFTADNSSCQESSTGIHSGAGECCAPKLLQAAYSLGLKPLAMAEFWWGPSIDGRQQGIFYPACQRKCRPILGHMLQGLNVEADPAAYYNKVKEPLSIIWQDDDVAVICKPTGWLSVPGKTPHPNVLDEAHRLWPNIEGPVIVHRLDQDTSGLMLIAKTLRAYHALQHQFESHTIKKRYVALLEHEPAMQQGTISLPISPDYDDLPRQRIDHEHGAEAITNYEVLGKTNIEGQDLTRVAFYPHTGRTHQLRLHAASPLGLNSPILGDRLYGRLAARLYLHAEQITFCHPITGETLTFNQPPEF